MAGRRKDDGMDECPNCGSDDVEYEDIDEHHNRSATTRMRCRKCDHFWLVNEPPHRPNLSD
jgi:DNA-directed RNA polymerase subunit M/transcription elongation factor TFIIS